MEHVVLNGRRKQLGLPHDILALSATHLAVAFRISRSTWSLSSTVGGLFVPKQLRKPERPPVGKRTDQEPRKLSRELLSYCLNLFNPC